MQRRSASWRQIGTMLRTAGGDTLSECVCVLQSGALHVDSEEEFYAEEISKLKTDWHDAYSC